MQTESKSAFTYLNSSRAEPKMLLSAQCQYPQNRNRMKKSKIAARLKIRTHHFFSFHPHCCHTN